MPTIGYRLLAVVFALLIAAADQPPPELRRGVNITHWFRFPPGRDPAALRAYLGDAALIELKRAGFTFVRLPVQPDMLKETGALADAVALFSGTGLRSWWRCSPPVGTWRLTRTTGQDCSPPGTRWAQCFGASTKA